MPRLRRAWSPSGVVGPFAASTRYLQRSESALSPVMIPPMAAGTSTSHSRPRMSFLSIFSPEITRKFHDVGTCLPCLKTPNKSIFALIKMFSNLTSHVYPIRRLSMWTMKTKALKYHDEAQRRGQILSFKMRRRLSRSQIALFGHRVGCTSSSCEGDCLQGRCPGRCQP